ncbi:MAG TPA: response regulator [Burkholderiales bacterium]
MKSIYVAQDKKFFRLTSEGRSLWARRKSLPLPLDYRRILGLVDYAGHPEVIRSYLARYPGHVVDEWLSEFEALKLIESIAATEVSLSEISRKTEPPPLEAEDIGNSELEVTFADISLTRLGVYVAYDRVANRPASSKRPEDTLALIVEDDPDQRALAVLRLTSAGYPVETADSVQGLFSALQKGTPDAIFLDIGLPDGDGFEVLATLRQHPVCAPLPIILLTAKSAPEDVAKGLALGADGYVTKPYGKNTLDYVLRYVMKQEVPAARTGEPRGRAQAA